MVRKGYNWKARRVVETVIDNTPTKKIEIEIGDRGNYDSCNALVLPSKKRDTKIKKSKEVVERILSKKQRKRLEKIVEKKNKKENRAALLEALQQVQVSSEELNQLTSIASVQTKGLKRLHQEEKYESRNETGEPPKKFKLNSISGAKKKRLSCLEEKKDGKEVDDPNVVGIDESDDDDDEESEEEEMKIENTDETVEIKNEDDEPVQNNESLEIKNESNNEEIVTSELISKSTEEKKKSPKKQDLNSFKTVFVPVIRTDEIEEARKKLPIIGMEQEIMESINENDIVVIAGETGSGKTTQLPQFLYEAGYATKGIIGISEPRRVAAISMSKRVAHEMCEDFNTGIVSYLIRYEGNATDKTKIKFMTDGVLLREVRTDLLLNKYSVIILDEAHERSVYTDVLLGILSRVVPLRRKRGNPLKLIVMSATLRLSDLTENSRLFKSPPEVVKVDARQFPVTIHFNRITPDDYVKEAFLKAVKIHSRLPEGGILIFVTGQAEVRLLVKRLRSTFPYDSKKVIETEGNDKKKKIKLPEIDLDEYALPGCDDEDEIELSEDEDMGEVELVNLKCRQPLWVLPLYSLLSTEKQSKVFEPPPPGCRLCVVATNVAETSLTIPGVRYVIDTGKTKERLYDKVTGATSYVVKWTSKASANQRAGRAGRIAPGHCYRIYSSAVYNDEFCEFPIPEIQRRPADDLYLQMKCLNIDNVINFPFPSAPDLLQLRTAEERLRVLGVINSDSNVTPLGRTVAQLPVLPQYGKMLALAHQQNLTNYVVCIVSGISVQELLLDASENQKLLLSRQKWSGSGQQRLLGDPMVLLRALGGAEHANFRGKLQQFCEQYGLRLKAVIEARKLRLQLTQAVKSFGAENAAVDPLMPPPDDVQCRLLRQIILSGSGVRVAVKSEENRGKGKKPLYLTADGMEEPVRLHKSCSLRGDSPEWIVYQELFETNGRMFIRGVTAIEPEWLPIYCPSLCNLSEPLPEPPPRYENGKVYCTVTGTFGRRAFILPPSTAEYPESLDAYRWFARFFLEGKVFPKLENFKKHLLSKPETMLKNWARLQPRTKTLLDALSQRGVRSENSCRNIWEEQPTFLLDEYRNWLPESAHAEVTLMWPPK